MFNKYNAGYFFTLLILLFPVACTKPLKNNATPFPTIESTIAQVHRALENKTSNCVSITKAFIKRIKTYDQSTKLNAITHINPTALDTARALDEEFLHSNRLRVLHCIPVIVKDNIDTDDMTTEAGSIALKGSIPPDDATIVKKLRVAGAIMLAKSNMSEWAFSRYRTISSTHGETRNAYDLSRVPAGSSGGSAAAIAASFGIIGMATDTGNSLRGPASHLSLVGLRATIGLVSFDGIVPLLSNYDVAGSITRTVEDTAKTLNIIANFDPTDLVNGKSSNKKQIDYTQYLKKSGLKGVRLAVLRDLFDTETADFDIIDLMDLAIVDLKKAGAIIIDPFEVKDFKKLVAKTRFCSRFRYDLNQYILSLGKNAPIKNFQEMIDKKLYGDFSSITMNWASSVTIPPEQQQPPCVDVQNDPRRKNLLTAIVSALEAHSIDAIIYPTWSNPAREIDDYDTPHGNNSPVISPHTGQPSITVPMGFTSEGLPAGLQFLVRHFEEAKLIQYAYAYEQQTLHRRPPIVFPELP